MARARCGTVAGARACVRECARHRWRRPTAPRPLRAHVIPPHARRACFWTRCVCVLLLLVKSERLCVCVWSWREAGVLSSQRTGPASPIGVGGRWCTMCLSYASLHARIARVSVRDARAAEHARKRGGESPMSCLNGRAPPGVVCVRVCVRRAVYGSPAGAAGPSRCPQPATHTRNAPEVYVCTIVERTRRLRARVGGDCLRAVSSSVNLEARSNRACSPFRCREPRRCEQMVGPV